MSENMNKSFSDIVDAKLEKYDDKFKLKGVYLFFGVLMHTIFVAGIFLTAVTGISAIFGFGATVVAVKKQDPKYFSKGIAGSIEMTETGASLALRALGWGSLYAVTGCGVLFYTIWKISGAKDLQEFKYKVGSILPRIPKNNPPQGRTEFEGMNDLLEYLSLQKGKKDS